MSILDAEVFDFLTDLQINNNRPWFEDNRDRYRSVAATFEQFIGGLINNIARFDPDIGRLQPRQCIFRIYRDTRFSKDKTPYKTSLGAHLLAGGRSHEANHAGYYLKIAPGGSLLAGGAYLPPGSWLGPIRQAICDNPAAFKKIIAQKSFKNYFGTIEGEKLKTAPRGFAKDHPEIELLRYKSFLAVHNLDDEQVTDAGFMGHTTRVFRALQPFAAFLNAAAP
ncbi:DUF2461 domain-containing protein [Exilibacterium tricleocarpae]|nr:DUF2461 domain-containing protein [Exilibacterium tricleocarpae]